MKFIASITLVFLSVLSFSQGETTIKIKVKKSKGDTVYLQHASNNQQLTIDTGIVNFWGTATLQTNVNETGFYQISKNLKQGIPLVLAGGESIKIKTSQDIINKYTISGSKDSELIHKYFRVKNDTTITKDSLANYAGKFIEENNKSLALFIALGDIKDQKKYFGIAEKGIGEAYPNSIYHKALQQAVTQLNPPKRQSGVGVGDVAPELDIPSPDGEIITLESLRGKYVLIDFWASWCAPCRRENPNVVKAYNKYKEAGFEVYSVSLDKDKNRWVQAIEKDGLVWNSHVSDLKGWGTKATRVYGFSGIPYTVLIDKEGKVIETRLRGQALDNKLEELFGF